MRQSRLCADGQRCQSRCSGFAAGIPSACFGPEGQSRVAFADGAWTRRPCCDRHASHLDGSGPRRLRDDRLEVPPCLAATSGACRRSTPLFLLAWCAGAPKIDAVLRMARDRTRFPGRRLACLLCTIRQCCVCVVRKFSQRRQRVTHVHKRQRICFEWITNASTRWYVACVTESARMLMHHV